MSSEVWQRQQYFSHSHELSDCSHWAQRYFPVLVPVDIVRSDGFTVAPGKHRRNVTLVICAFSNLRAWNGCRRGRKAFNRKDRKGKTAEDAKKTAAYVVYIGGAHFTARINCVSSPLPYNSEQ